MEPQYYESYFEDSFVGQLKPGSGADGDGDGDAESIPYGDEDLHPSNIEFEFDSFGPESFIHTPASASVNQLPNVQEKQSEKNATDKLPAQSTSQPPLQPTHQSKTQPLQQQQQPPQTTSISTLTRSSAQYSSIRKRVPVNLDLLSNNIPTNSTNSNSNDINTNTNNVQHPQKDDNTIQTSNITNVNDAPCQNATAENQQTLNRSSAQYSSIRKRVPVNLDLLADKNDTTTNSTNFSSSLPPRDQNVQSQNSNIQITQSKEFQREPISRPEPKKIEQRVQEKPSSLKETVNETNKEYRIEQDDIFNEERDGKAGLEWGDLDFSSPDGVDLNDPGVSIKQIDLKVIEPYKKIISHAGYCHSFAHTVHEKTPTLSAQQIDQLNNNTGPTAGIQEAPPAIIVFSACYLPDRSRRDYCYVMDHLFLYVLSSLHELIADDYILIYLHNSCPDQNNLPTFGLLKRFYQMIDRKLRKNLKALYLVHPTFWLKTLVIMSRPFISAKFSRKIHFVPTIDELGQYLPLGKLVLPASAIVNLPQEPQPSQHHQTN